MFAYGTTSKERLSQAHPDWIVIMNNVIRITPIDLGIAETYRTIEKQFEYFSQGKSKIDGKTRKGKHNYLPSMAIDIYAYIDGNASWDPESISYLAGLIHATAEMLLLQGKISHRVRWGGNWDMDGTILLDQSFDDRPHFELINA